MFHALKVAARTTITRHRHAAVLRPIRRVCQFVEQAAENEGSFFEVNGERKLLERLASAKFKTVLDVGANVGDWSIAAAKLWPSASIYAFEVSPRTRADLEKQVAETGLSQRVLPVSAGMSDKAGTQVMYYYPYNPELTCEELRHDASAAVPFDAVLTTVDQFAAEKGINAIDFLKIDVEGSEYKVLRGAKGLLEKRAVSCIQFEYGAFSVTSRFLLADYFNMLKNDFFIGKIFPNGVDFKDYDWTMDNFRFCNYVCVSRNRTDLKDAVSV